MKNKKYRPGKWKRKDMKLPQPRKYCFIQTKTTDKNNSERYLLNSQVKILFVMLMRICWKFPSCFGKRENSGGSVWFLLSGSCPYCRGLASNQAFCDTLINARNLLVTPLYMYLKKKKKGKFCGEGHYLDFHYAWGFLFCLAVFDFYSLVSDKEKISSSIPPPT